LAVWFIFKRLTLIAFSVQRRRFGVFPGYTTEFGSLEQGLFNLRIEVSLQIRNEFSTDDFERKLVLG
jgi:hypothetical protein